LKKTVYIGLRQLLSWHHILRWYGQSKNCCPVDFYNKQIYACSETYSFLTDTEKNNLSPRTFKLKYFQQLPKKVKINNTTTDDKNKQVDYFYGKCETDVSDKDLQLFYNDKNKQYLWHHRNFNFNLFKNSVYYQHCDLRKQIIHERKKNEVYISEAKAVYENPDLKDCNGVKGLWHEHRLPYVKIEETINWDPMHVLKNIGERVIDLWKGERFKDKVIDFCKNIQVHHDFTNGNYQPWSIGNNNLQKNVIIITIIY